MEDGGPLGIGRTLTCLQKAGNYQDKQTAKTHTKMGGQNNILFS